MLILKKFFTILFAILLVVLAGYAIWLRLPTGVAGIAWQSPQECIVNCGQTATGVQFGAYDPQGKLAGEEKLTVDHIFLSWADNNDALLSDALTAARAKKHILFISLEPWPSEGRSKDSLLTDVVAGMYDNTTKSFCNTLGNFGGEIWLSWGHEMDHDLTERYPWSHRDPAEFVQAYTHFVSVCRPYANYVKFVWSPVGNKNLAQYWPGSSTVDMIGVPVYAYPKFDKDVYGDVRTFAQAFGEKYDRVKAYNKPVSIVELGVFGDESYQQWWLTDAGKQFGKFPLLSSVILFNAADTPGAWGEKYESPDWRLHDGVVLP